MKQLLVDYNSVMTFTPQYINESINQHSGKLIVSGPLQRAGVKNQNGRIYPKEVLVREAKKYYDTFIVERRALGELDHPDSAVVNLKNVSHNIIDMYWKGDDLIGKIEILPTPSGNILKELFRSGIKVGVSSRGLGTVKEITENDGYNALEVQDDFELIAWDFVSNPSTHGAFVFPTADNKVNESVVKNTLTKNEDVKYAKVNKVLQELICELSCECNLR
jgi:hypothetical protein